MKLTGLIYLHDKTVNFGFQPGVRINEGKLASSLGMSRAPVREALNRLVALGLVLFQPGKGFFCRKLSMLEISELFEVRSDFELSAIQQICEKSSDEEINKLYNEWLLIEDRQSNLSIETLVEVDETFHMGLLALTNNSERIKFMENINDRIRFVRQINLENENRRKKFIGEHTKIMEAIIERNTSKVLTLMKNHLDVNSKDLEANIREGLARIYAENVGLDH